MSAIELVFDLGKLGFLAATCGTSMRYGLRRLAGDWSFYRSGVTVTGAIDQIHTPEAGTFSVYRFTDDLGTTRVVRTPGDEVLRPNQRVQLVYVPQDDSRAIERPRLVRKLLGTVAGLGLGTSAAAAEIAALVTIVWPH